MENEFWRLDTKKAMAYDLCMILDAEPSKENYTKDEIKRIITTYIIASESN